MAVLLEVQREFPDDDKCTPYIPRECTGATAQGTILFNTTVHLTPSTPNVTLSGDCRTWVDLSELIECSPFRLSVLS